jgi:hypothetical protein
MPLVYSFEKLHAMRHFFHASATTYHDEGKQATLCIKTHFKSPHKMDWSLNEKDEQASQVRHGAFLNLGT